MKKALVIALLVLLAVAIAIQLVRPERDNPDVVALVVVDDPQVEQILRRACFDCHSHETRWPWYSAVAPASWLVVHDVEEAREHLNFSNWEPDPHLFEEICEEVGEGHMPLKKYLALHPDARLSEGDRETICGWAKSQENALRTGSES